MNTKYLFTVSTIIFFFSLFSRVVLYRKFAINPPLFPSGGTRLDTDQLDTTNHSDRCLKTFHCSSAVSGLRSIDSCPNGGHSSKFNPISSLI